MFYKEGVLRNFARFTGKHLCQRLFFNKVRPATPFLQNTSGRLLLFIANQHFIWEFIKNKCLKNIWKSCLGIIIKTLLKSFITDSKNINDSKSCTQMHVYYTKTTTDTLISKKILVKKTVLSVDVH